MKRFIKVSLFSIMSALVIVGCSPEQFGDPTTDADFANELTHNPSLGASKGGKNGKEGSKSGSRSQSASNSNSGSQSASQSSSEDDPGGLACECTGGITSLKFSANSGGTVNVYNNTGDLLASFPATKPGQEILLTGDNGQPLPAEITIEIVTFSGIEVIVLDLSCAVEVLGPQGSITVTERTDTNGVLCN